MNIGILHHIFYLHRWELFFFSINLHNFLFVLSFYDVYKKNRNLLINNFYWKCIWFKLYRDQYYQIKNFCLLILKIYSCWKQSSNQNHLILFLSNNLQNQFTMGTQFNFHLLQLIHSQKLIWLMILILESLTWLMILIL